MRWHPTKEKPRTEIEIEMGQSDDFIWQVRHAISKWKEAQLIHVTQDDQDTTRLNGYLKITALAYDMIIQYLDSDGEKKVDSSLYPILHSLGHVSSLSRDQEMLLREYLFRDLVEYPFTYNTELINSFQKKNVLDTNIIPNK